MNDDSKMNEAALTLALRTAQYERQWPAPANVLIVNSQTDRETWLAERRKGITASDVAAILGVHPYRTPLMVAHDKLGLAKPEEESDDMWLGTELQPTIAKMFTRKTGIEVLPAECLAAHPVHSWAMATPDYFLKGRPGVLECKKTNMRLAHRWKDGNVPDEAHIQIIWQLGVFAYPVGFAACMKSTSAADYVDAQITSDPQLFEQLLEVGDNFRQMLERGDLPEATALDRDLLADTTRDMSEVELTDEADLLMVESYAAHRRQKTAAGKLLRDLNDVIDMEEARIMKRLGKSRFGIAGRNRIDVRRIQRKGFVVKPSSYVRIFLETENEEVQIDEDY